MGPKNASTSRHDDVFFINPEIGWVVNGHGDIYKTTNGGASWANQAMLPTYIRCVGFIDSLHGFAGSLYGPLYETTDGGTSWTTKIIDGPAPAGLCGIWVVDSQVVYISGKYSGPARVVKTTDGGATWSSTDLSAYASGLVDCYFTTRTNGFVVGYKDSTATKGFARILATTDGGTTWQTRYAGTRRGELCWKITFPSPTIGYVSIENFNEDSVICMKTTDGGSTWNRTLVGLGGRTSSVEAQGIGFVTPLYGWVGGWQSNPITFETTDGGESWNQVSFGKNINRFRFLNDSTGYAVGVGVYKYSNGSITSVDREDSIQPDEITLFQSYPNPFNPMTAISFQLSAFSDVSLAVFDALGRLVATLVEGRLSPGIHNVTWDAGDRPSGVYFYRLRVGETTITKKLVLLR